MARKMFKGVRGGKSNIEEKRGEGQNNLGNG